MTDISPGLRAVWLREHELFVRFLRRLSAGDRAERCLGDMFWRECLMEGLEAAEAAEAILSASFEDAEGRA